MIRNTLLAIVGLCLMAASLLASSVGTMHDREGDGVQDRQSLTSWMLGYNRFAYCDQDPDLSTQRGWDCPLFGAQVTPMHSSSSPLASVVPPNVGSALSKNIGAGTECMLGILLCLPWFITAAKRS